MKKAQSREGQLQIGSEKSLSRVAGRNEEKPHKVGLLEKSIHRVRDVCVHWECVIQRVLQIGISDKDAAARSYTSCLNEESVW